MWGLLGQVGVTICPGCAASMSHSPIPISNFAEPGGYRRWHTKCAREWRCECGAHKAIVKVPTLTSQWGSSDPDDWDLVSRVVCAFCDKDKRTQEALARQSAAAVEKARREDAARQNRLRQVEQVKANRSDAFIRNWWGGMSTCFADIARQYAIDTELYRKRRIWYRTWRRVWYVIGERHRRRSALILNPNYQGEDPTEKRFALLEIE